MRGLAASGAPERKDAIAKAAQWLRTIQNPDGGWGESCASYDRDRFVPAPSCASQTAWAVLGLLAAGDRDGAAVRRGIQFLLDRQRPDGTWPEEATTGTGFPNVFYLTYGMYRDYFPLLALAQCKRRLFPFQVFADCERACGRAVGRLPFPPTWGLIQCSLTC